MTCRELSDSLGDYLAGDLDPAERSAFESHLNECADCVWYLRNYEETVRLGKRAFDHPHDPAPDEVPEGLVRAVLAALRTIRH